MDWDLHPFFSRHLYFTNFCHVSSQTPLRSHITKKSLTVTKYIYVYICRYYMVYQNPNTQVKCHTSYFEIITVNSVQEACAKCFAVHILKFEILQITRKKSNKKHQTLTFQFFINIFSLLMFFVRFPMRFARFQIVISI